MASWPNTVDPEKHLLGNLLDDDSALGSPPARTSRPSPSSGIPMVSVIDGVGAISSTGAHNFWPEPPPPYTPAPTGPDFNWQTTTARTTSGEGSMSDFLKGLGKDWNTVLSPDYSYSNTGATTPTEIHHHHHDIHHHTHVRNVIENHHHYGPLDVIPLPGFQEIAPQPFASIIKSHIEKDQQKAPHSAPVVHKMPFSYRDVAARSETNSTGHSPPQQVRKSTLAIDTELKTESAVEASYIVDIISNKKSKNSNDGKQKANEFQKISRKKRSKEKNSSENKSIPARSSPVPESIIVQPTLERKQSVDGPTKYHILEKLSSPKIVKADSVESDDVFVPVRLEDSSRQNVSRKDLNKKRGVSVTTAPSSNHVKKRCGRSKNQQHHWIFALLVSFAVCMMESLLDGLKWLMTLIVDVCSQMSDVILYGFFTAWEYVADSIKCAFGAVIAGIWQTIMDIRHLSIWKVLQNARTVKKLGLDENVLPPNNIDEIFNRLLALENVDAYSVLGLCVGCSAEQILRHAEKLQNVLCTDKNFTDGVEDAIDLVQRAVKGLHSFENRASYGLCTVQENAVHDDIVAQWQAVRERVNLSRNRMHCDCGRPHQRSITDKNPLEARYCKKCGVNHCVKANDIWVESSMWGIMRTYYACIEGAVYDISEWATCEVRLNNYLKHMKANTHTIQYRLVSGNDRQDLADCCEEGHRGSAQVSYRPPEIREEDRSRRAANRRQKRR